MPDFKLPGATDRTVVIGPTGTGKTIGGAWLLSKQRLDKRPWVALDFKSEELWDMVGDPPMRPLALGSVPKKPGLYRMPVMPGQEDRLEEWLWKVWEKGNIGLFADEVSLMPQKAAFKAILRQGRSKHIPVIACTQRPVDCDREVFTESGYRMLYGIGDKRDWQTIQGLFQHSQLDVTIALPQYWSYWYDDKQKHCWRLRPTPDPDSIAKSIREIAPYSWFFG